MTRVSLDHHDLVASTVRSAYLAHEHDQFIARYHGLLHSRVRDKYARLRG